ncbi:MAG TPA: TIGR01841 family phasin [Noviherbaspirillum sp.]|uniref:TIGR01841 family phasin n=1 Tax=Noviherbaspirillum sp. TaxID=1926288 RepID=UPI002D2F8B81|nr:TIGR01841 family phasin [Noviherbaspirillum sp.]HYD94838.1 TIGR01841 family phasin [Noviherbaspirillum sp.]
MFPMQDQISVATKANFEANLALVASLTSKTLESMEKLINLNIAAARASMEESQAATRQILAAKDPQEFFSLVASQTKPNFEKAVAYGNHVTNIAGSVQAEFSKAAESQFAQFSRKITELVEDAAQKAPVGSDGMVAAIKAAMGNASSAYDQFTKSAKQAAEVVEASVNGTVAQFAQSAGATTNS